MPFTELVSLSLTDLFVKKIRDMILSGELKTGEKLPTERQLASQMKVSTSVVNGGIKKLTETGFLTVRPRKGVFVADYIREGNLSTLDAIMEYGDKHFQKSIFSFLVDFRKNYEIEFTRKACRNRTKENLDILSSLLKQMDETNDIESLSDLSYRFHHEIAVASGDVIQASFAASIRTGYVSSYRTMLGQASTIALREYFSHLYQAILDKDEDGAEELIQKAIESWVAAYQKLFTFSL